MAKRGLIARRVFHCGICGAEGHTRVKCPEPSSVMQRARSFVEGGQETALAGSMMLAEIDDARRESEEKVEQYATEVALLGIMRNRVLAKTSELRLREG